MGQKINIFYMLKATKIAVFGLVLACVFCGDLYADQVEVTGSVSANYSVDGAPVDVEALETAHVCAIDNTDKVKRCVLTDESGNFKIGVNCTGEKLILSYVGCEPVTVDRSEIFGHNCGATVIEKSLDCVTEIDTVTVTGCRKFELGINTGTLQGDKCIPSSCDEPRWVLRGVDDNARCVVQECRGGNWHLVGDAWKCVGGEIIPAEPDDEVGDDVESPTQADDNTDYEALAEQAREREQSTGNKLLGAVGMGATGIGGSMLLSGMSETKSDEDAERAMKAYLSTFTCKYGNESVPGGTMNVEIPGGNELIQMYADYVALANDLKVRKEALGMKPGIESEAILDSATSGLYDDVSTGKTKGVYASLARALSDPNSEDAKLWAAQREESDEKKKTGAIVAGIGAIGSLLGDVAINKIDWKSKRNKALRDLEDNVSNITPVRIRCPSDAHGTYYPDCTCKDSNKVYNANMNRCDACPYDHIVVDGLCQCPQNTIESNGRCVESPRMSTVLRKVADDVMQKLSDEPAVLSADNLFKHGSAILTNDAKAALNTFIDQLSGAGATVCKPVVKGYADPSGLEDVNERLSKLRAESVAKYLDENSDELINDVVIEYYGEADCTCGLRNKVPAEQIDYTKDDYKVCKDQEDGYSVSENNKSSRYAPCRRVEITHGCESGGGDLGGVISGGLESVASTLADPQ